MSPQELENVWLLLGGCFPNSPNAMSKAVRFTWGQALQNFTHHEVCTAVYGLASRQINGRSVRFPELSQILELAKAERKERFEEPTAYLTRPMHPTTPEEYLKIFAKSAIESRMEDFTEIATYFFRMYWHGESGYLIQTHLEELNQRLAEVESVGPHEKAARRAIANGAQQNQWFSGSLGAILKSVKA